MDVPWRWLLQPVVLGDWLLPLGQHVQRQPYCGTRQYRCAFYGQHIPLRGQATFHLHVPPVIGTSGLSPLFDCLKNPALDLGNLCFCGHVSCLCPGMELLGRRLTLFKMFSVFGSFPKWLHVHSKREGLACWASSPGWLLALFTVTVQGRVHAALCGCDVRLPWLVC